MPPSRSTTTTTFNPDRKTLASMHGDRIVKIIDCHTIGCLKVLTSHRRTPWVVRSHPVHPEILASGSLDYEVHIWDANTAECIGSRDFYHPIASIAFHAKGELLVVASRHKLYVQHYSRRWETSSPTIILKIRRSLRVVHFLLRYYKCLDIRILVVLSLYHSFLVSFFPILNMYTLYMNE